MKRPESVTIPVFLSRHTARSQLPHDYGGKIGWHIGERVALTPSPSGKPWALATVQSGLLWHDGAPVIDSAHGAGRWVIEVTADDTGERVAVIASDVRFPDEVPV